MLGSSRVGIESVLCVSSPGLLTAEAPLMAARAAVKKDTDGGFVLACAPVITAGNKLRPGSAGVMPTEPGRKTEPRRAAAALPEADVPADVSAGVSNMSSSSSSLLSPSPLLHALGACKDPDEPLEPAALRLGARDIRLAADVESKGQEAFLLGGGRAIPCRSGCCGGSGLFCRKTLLLLLPNSAAAAAGPATPPSDATAAAALLCTSMNLLLTRDRLRCAATAGASTVLGSLGMAGDEGAPTSRLDDFSDARRASMSSSVLVVVASADASSSACAAVCRRTMELFRR